MLARFLFRSKSIKFKILTLISIYTVLFVGIIALIVVPLFHKKLYESSQKMTRISVETLASAIDALNKQVEQKELSLEVAQKMAFGLIRNARYNGSEYFWVHDLDNKMLIHGADKTLDGKNLDKKKDPNGKYLFREMTKLVKEKGAGHLDYLWPKPGATLPQPKVSVMFFTINLGGGLSVQVFTLMILKRSLHNYSGSFG